MRKVIANKTCKGGVLQPLSFDFPEAFFCGCESLPNLYHLGKAGGLEGGGRGRDRSAPILQEQGKNSAGHGNIWGVLLVELFIPGGRVLLLGVSKQHH